MWDSLFANIAVIALVLVVWQTIADGVDLSGPRLGGAAIGLLLGLAACLSILTASEVLPGVLIDLRSAMVASAAFFGGPIAALIAVGVTGGLRAYLGGSGLMAGLVAISTAALFGLFLRHWLGGATVRAKHVGMLALGVSVTYGFAYLFTPLDIMGAVFTATFFPMFAVNFVTTFCFASLALREIRRQDLVRTDAIYRQMVEFLPDPVIAKDRAGRIIAANPASASVLGFAQSEELLGKSNADYLSPDAVERANVEEVAVLQSGETIRLEDRVFRNGDTERWLSIKKVAVTDPSGKPIGLVVVGRDVTEQHRLLKMKSEFVSLVSHELRTPLTSVRGALGLLASSLPADASDGARNLLGIAQRNSERLVRLINDILDVEKIEDGSLEFRLAPQALGPLIRDTLPGFEKYMPDQKVSVRFEDRAPGAIAQVDAGRFEQVLSNLVSNAIKFSVPGSTVTIGLEHAADDLLLSVCDRGSGISEAFRARVFERFEQSDASDTRAKGGTGLGLHIAKVFVEKMGGTIGFESAEGQGTTFFVRLPAQPSAPVPVPVAVQEDQPRGNALPKRILYIEDDGSLGSIITECLAGEATVDHVTTLKAAREAVARGTYDLLLIDDELPDGSGMSLIEGGENLPPSIVFTAREVRCPAGAEVLHRFIKTRVEERQVVDAIRDVLGHRTAA